MTNSVAASAVVLLPEKTKYPPTPSVTRLPPPSRIFDRYAFPLRKPEHRRYHIIAAGASGSGFRIGTILGFGKGDGVSGIASSTGTALPLSRTGRFGGCEGGFAARFSGVAALDWRWPHLNLRLHFRRYWLRGKRIWPRKNLRRSVCNDNSGISIDRSGKVSDEARFGFGGGQADRLQVGSVSKLGEHRRLRLRLKRRE